MGHAHPQESMNTKNSEEELLIFRHGVISDAPTTGSTLQKKQVSESHLHLLDTVEAVLKLEELLVLESIPIADIHTSHVDGKIYRVARCLKISDRSSKCLKLRYDMPCFLS